MVMEFRLMYKKIMIIKKSEYQHQFGEWANESWQTVDISVT